MGEKKPYFDELDDVSADDVVIATEAQFDETTTSRTGATALRWVLTLIVFFLFAGMGWLTWSLAPVLFSCMHVVLEWERSVVLRFGKFNRVAGPGLIFMIPLVEYSAATVDMRMRSTAFKAEHVLTADLVPVNVDAVLFWTVWDAGKACSEVKNYVRLVYWAAQTTLRDVMGAVNIAQLSTRREQIDREVADILERKTNEWGITLAEVEKEISEMFVDAARTYGREDAALQLRAMSFVSDSVREKGGLVVIPSALSEAFEGLENIAKKA